MQLPPRHKARFTISARAYQPTPALEGEVRASIEKLKGLLPADIDPAAHPTLLYVVGNLFVPGLLNKNDDGVSIEDGLRLYRSFEWQQINLEHNRGSVVGFIVKAGLSEFGTDRLITEDEARAAGKPYNVAIVVALWKVVDKDLVHYILESSLPGSPGKDTLSLSFEVGFDEYSVVTLPKGVTNLAMATKTIAPSAPDYDQWDKRLRANKGSGVTKGGERVGRVLIWPIIAMGGGIVGMPAGPVKGLTPILPEDGAEEIEEVEATETDAGIYEYSSTQVTLSAEAAAPFLAYAAAIPEEHLYQSEDPEEDGKYGREDEPHITALYGIKSNDIGALPKVLADCGAVHARLGKVTAFVRDDKPYDVLKVDVASEDLHRLNALIKASCDHDDQWPEYHPHLTIAYIRKGRAAQYVGDTRFEGMELSFSSVTWSPAEGDRIEIPLGALTAAAEPVAATQSADQTAADPVYSTADPCDIGSALASMPSQPTRLLKLSAGWQEKLVSMQGEARATPDGKTIYAGWSNGIDVTLSDGRVIKAMKVVDASSLESDIEISYDGVVITSMTPGVAAPEYMPPGKEDVYPTKDPEARAREQAEQEKKEAAQKAGYTSAAEASLDEINRTFELLSESLASFGRSLFRVTQDSPTPTVQAYLSANTTAAGVSLSTPNPTDSPNMKLEDLKQAVASVKSPEDLPTLMANVTSFVDVIAKASEEQVKAREAAEQTVKQTQATLSEVEAKLATLTKSHNDLIAAQQAAAAEKAYQDRMTAAEEVFAFDDDARTEIVNEIKACADDAAFTKWMARAKKMYKGYLKAAAAPVAETKAADDKKEEKKEEMMKKDDECKAATKEAIASATSVDAPITNTVEAGTGGSIIDRYKAILTKHASIGGQSIGALNEEAAKTVKKTR